MDLGEDVLQDEPLEGLHQMDDVLGRGSLTWEMKVLIWLELTPCEENLPRNPQLLLQENPQVKKCLTGNLQS